MDLIPLNETTYPADASIREHGKILQAVFDLAEKCGCEAQHTRQVTQLALSLFDELYELHQLDGEDRFRLEYAALLHDIGLLEGVKSHHRTTLRIILETPLLPLDMKERLIIGSIARYHRKSLPALAHDHFAALDATDQHTVNRLAALLRLADGLDHDHKSHVQNLICKIRPRKVVVRCTGAKPSPEEMQVARKKSDLFVLAYQRKLEIEWKPSL